MPGAAHPPIPCLRRIEPTVSSLSNRFVWTRGADVQATWRQHGWTPPSEGRTPIIPDEVKPSERVTVLKRKAR